MSDSSQNGKLMSGGIGTLILGVLLLLGNFVAQLNLLGGMRGGGGGGEGTVVIAIIVAAVLFILSATGWFAAGNVYGGTNLVAGIFFLIAALGALGSLVAIFVMKDLDVLTYSAIAMLGGLALGSIFGGIGLFSGQAQGQSGPIKPIAAVVLLVGGIGITWVSLGMFMQGGLPIMDIMGNVGKWGMPSGLILAGLTKILSRVG